MSTAAGRVPAETGPRSGAGLWARAARRQTLPMRRAAGTGVTVLVLGLAAGACSSGGTPASSGTTSTTAKAAPRVPVSTTSSTASTTSTTAAAATTTSTSSSSAGGQPTLGVAAAFPGGTGFGQVQPPEISLGGDPTGTLSAITWQSWGGTQATGTGTSTYVAPGKTVAQGVQATATVVAYDLGTCGGAPAYQQVSWYFPEYGQTPADNGSTPVNACTGP